MLEAAETVLEVSGVSVARCYWSSVSCPPEVTMSRDPMFEWRMVGRTNAFDEVAFRLLKRLECFLIILFDYKIYSNC